MVEKSDEQIRIVSVMLPGLTALYSFRRMQRKMHLRIHWVEKLNGHHMVQGVPTHWVEKLSKCTELQLTRN